MSKQTPEATKAYRDKNKERIKDYQRSYFNSPEYSKKRKEYYRKNPTKQLLYNAKNRAKKRGIDFDIVETDIIIPTHCPILGIPLFQKDRKAGPNSPTLDQINPGIGYVKDNVCVISHKANTMKQNNTVEDFERFIRYMKGKL